MATSIIDVAMRSDEKLIQLTALFQFLYQELGGSALTGPGFLYTIFNVTVFRGTRCSFSFSRSRCCWGTAYQLSGVDTSLGQHRLEFGQLLLVLSLSSLLFLCQLQALQVDGLNLFVRFFHLFEGQLTQRCTQTADVHQYFQKFTHNSPTLIGENSLARYTSRRQHQSQRVTLIKLLNIVLLS
ncbi:hypothetical protein OI71_14010 [Aeromonas hydrophila]|nr:hypothetical protein OI71_14010 [Aeromonas hydrophila]